MSPGTQSLATCNYDPPDGSLAISFSSCDHHLPDGSVVDVLLPDMVEDLGLTQTDAQWVNSIYSLVIASLLIMVGLLSDRFGRRISIVPIAITLACSFLWLSPRPAMSQIESDRQTR